MIGDIILKLTASGMSRAGSMLFKQLARQKRVSAALKGEVSRNSALQTAISDFEMVLSHEYGAFTVDVDNFLRELEKTGLIVALLEEALLNNPLKATKEAFVLLYCAVTKRGDVDAEKLYNALTLALRASVEEMVGDRGLSLLITAQTSMIATKLSQIESALNVACASAANKYELATNNILKVAKGLQNHLKNVKVETNKGARTIEIAQIFIKSKFRIRVNDDDERIIKAEFDDGIEYEHVWDPAKLSYIDFKNNFGRVVILGDPGGGKTTFCQSLCYELAKDTAFELQSGPRQEIRAQCQKIPLRVVLKSYERARGKEPQLSIFEFIARDLRSHCNCSDEEIRAVMDYCLTYGRALIAFDGLDEILETALRREFVGLVEAFCSQYPLCPVLVTSRHVGYEEAPLADDFEQVFLEKFDRAEILHYVSKFMRVVAGKRRDEAEQDAVRFLDQTDSHATDLRENPLMLGLMSWLFYTKRDVPSNRPEIYRECAVLMFERCDQNRGIKADIPDDFDLLHLFSMIASEIYGQAELEEGVSSDWLERSSRSYFGVIYDDKGRAIRSAKSIVKFLTGRAWVMTEVGDGVFKFTHRTFLEYFFARHIDEKFDTVSQVFKFIRPRILASEWNEVNHLALQQKTFRNPRRIQQAVELLHELVIKLPRSQKQKLSALTFSAKALEYLPAAESSVSSLIEAICREVFLLSDRRSIKAVKVLIYCSACSSERRAAAREALASSLHHRYLHGGRDDKNFVLELLGARWPDGMSRFGRSARLSADVVSSAVEKMKLAVRHDAMSSELAACAVALCPELALEVLSRFGLDVIFNRSGLYQFDPFAELLIQSYRNISIDEFFPPRSSLEVLNAMLDLSARGIPIVRSVPENRDIRLSLGFWSKKIDEVGSDARRFCHVMICLFTEIEIAEAYHHDPRSKNWIKLRAFQRSRACKAAEEMLRTFSDKDHECISLIRKWMANPLCLGLVASRPITQEDAPSPETLPTLLPS